jgi:hypothetical protein
MLHDMLLKTIALFSVIIIIVNSLFSASTALFFRRLTASLAGAQHYIRSVKQQTFQYILQQTNSITHTPLSISMQLL